MEKDFFVILNLPNGDYTYMTLDDDCNLAKYESKEEAEQAAKTSVLGYEFGYEIFERGLGE